MQKSARHMPYGIFRFDDVIGEAAVLADLWLLGHRVDVREFAGILPIPNVFDKEVRAVPKYAPGEAAS